MRSRRSGFLGRLAQLGYQTGLRRRESRLEGSKGVFEVPPTRAKKGPRDRRPLNPLLRLLTRIVLCIDVVDGPRTSAVEL